MVRGFDRVPGFDCGGKGEAGMKNCAAQSATLWAETVSSCVAHSPGLFVKKPPMVSLDFSISSDACRLYDIISLKNYKKAARTNLVDISVRGMAALFCKSPSTISRWLKQLERGRHIEKLSTRGERAVYRLLSPVFTYRVAVETAPNATATISSDKLPILRDKKRKCPKCLTVKHLTSSSGVCDECLKEWQRRVSA